jgi:hypothetical protein
MRKPRLLLSYHQTNHGPIATRISPFHECCESWLSRRE